MRWTCSNFSNEKLVVDEDGSVHFFSSLLKHSIFSMLLISSGTMFQASAPRKQKLLLARVSVDLGMMIFFLMLSLERKLARYSGSLVFLIFETAKTEWKKMSWFTLSHLQSASSNLLAIGQLKLIIIV